MKLIPASLVLGVVGIVASIIYLDWARLNPPIEVAGLDCRQIAGWQGEPPVVFCVSDRLGKFSWQANLNGWTTFYATTRWSTSSGFEFTTLPPGKLVRVLFGDANGVVSEALIRIYSDYRECTPANHCYRVAR